MTEPDRNVTPGTTDSSHSAVPSATNVDRRAINGAPSTPFWPMNRPWVGLFMVERLAHMAVARKEADDA